MRYFAAVFAALFCQSVLAAETRSVSLPWRELGGMIAGREITVKTPAGQGYKGRASRVDDAAIYFESGRTLRLARADVAEIRLVDYDGNGRRIGKLAGGALGLMLGLGIAAALGMREGSNEPGKKAYIYAIAIGGLPGGLAGGYYLGRLADKQVTVIRVIPEPAR